MTRHWPSLLLVALIVALQYPLWLGKGGWLQAWEAERALDEQRALNARLEARNAALEADVKDLKTGFDAVEERARSELGLVKPGEVFVQVPRSNTR
ncbi:cell division protein FtsB [Methyloversatilis sp.]|uniref:cell division protein FtsB n=1 Tax=Methyloversatilis sp. TaxID=2569862 RepID=UPI0035B3647C